MASPRSKSLVHALTIVALLVALAIVAPALDTPASRLHPQHLLNAYTHTILYDIGINIMLALGLNLILGMTGQFSLGHAGFLAAGAYTSIVITGKPELMLPQLAFWHSTLGLPMAAAMVLLMLTGIAAAVLVSATLGFVVGLPALRLRGDYLAIATLGFGEILAVLITNSGYLGRSTGLNLYGMRSEYLATLTQPDALARSMQNYLQNTPYLVNSFWLFGGVLLSIMIVRNTKYSTTGRALLAIREDEIASESVGVPTTRYKVTAFVIGAGLAGLAGGLLSHHKPLNPESFRFTRSVEIVLIVILGGQGSITGSILAAIGITVLPEFLRSGPLQAWGLDANVIDKWRMVIYSLLIILTMLFRPQGILGRYEITDGFAWLRGKWRRRTPVEPPTAEEQAAFAAEFAARQQPLPAGQPMLEVSAVTMLFGGLKAVDDFALRLMPGELVGLIGPNGAGKTTVFNLLTGVYRPTAGTIRLAGASTLGRAPHAISSMGAARTFQNIRLFANLSVVGNVQIAQHMHHEQGMVAAILRVPAFYREEHASHEVALELLELFGLRAVAYEQATSLSYGDQRRLEIARALATRPRLLLLDEPAAGMNPTEKRALMEMIRRIRNQFALTILLIEHDMKVVMGTCERILVLDYGKTIAEGTPEEIRRNPAVIEAYLGTGAKV